MPQGLTLTMAKLTNLFLVPTLFALQCLIPLILLETTSKQSIQRRLSLPLLGYIAYLQCDYARHISSSVFWRSSIATGSFIAFTHYFNILCIARIDLISHDGARAPAVETTLRRFQRSFRLLTASRGAGTQWQIQGIHPFPSFYRTSPPHRVQFLLRQMAIITWHYLLLDLLCFLVQQQTQNEKILFWGPEKELVYVNATIQQWTARVITSLVLCLGTLRIWVDFNCRVHSVIFVGLGFDSPDMWPPIFGSMRDAYTLRRFWGGFWHQQVRWPFTNIADAITHHTLHIPRKSLLARYVRLTLVFFLSGLLHVIGNTGGGIEGANCATMLVFTSFSLAIMFEDAVQEIWRWKGPQNSIPLWQRGLGYIWVAGWFCIVVPFYWYPVLRMPRDDYWIVPVSVVRELGVSLTSVVIVLGGVILNVVFKAAL